MKSQKSNIAQLVKSASKLFKWRKKMRIRKKDSYRIEMLLNPFTGKLQTCLIGPKTKPDSQLFDRTKPHRCIQFF